MLLAKKWVIGTSLAMAGVVGGWDSSNALATTVTLNDANSTVRFDSASASGEYDWVIDSVDVLTRQWFWYRIGNSGPATSIDQIDATPVIVTTDTAPNTGDNLLQLTYENTTLKISLIYSLSGGQPGSGVATMTQFISIQAKQAITGPVWFYQYADFNLSANDIDSLNVTNGNTARQTGDDGSIQQSPATPAPTRYQVDVGANLLALLASGALTLDNNTHTVTGDVNWLFAWNLGSMSANQQKFISIPQTVRIYPAGHNVPEPAAMVLFAAGVGLLMFGRRVGRRHRPTA